MLPLGPIEGTDVAHIFAGRVKRIAHLGHMIENPGNFGVCEDGRVRIVDGGSEKLERMLGVSARYGEIATALCEIKELIGDI